MFATDRIHEGSRGCSTRGLLPIIQHLTHAPKTDDLRLMVYDRDRQRNTRSGIGRAG